MGRPVSLATKDRDLVDYYAIDNMEVEVAQDFAEVQAGDLSLLQRKAFHIKSVHLENTGVQLFADSKKLKCK